MSPTELANMILEGKIDPSSVFTGKDIDMENQVKAEVFKCFSCGRWKGVQDKLNDIFDTDMCVGCFHKETATVESRQRHFKRRIEKLTRAIVGNFLPCPQDYALDEGYSEYELDEAMRELTECPKCACWCYTRSLIGPDHVCRTCYYDPEGVDQ